MNTQLQIDIQCNPSIRKLHQAELYHHVMEATAFSPNKVKIRERTYWVTHTITTLLKCKTCDTPVNFLGPSTGYRKYCGSKSRVKDPEWEQKRATTGLLSRQKFQKHKLKDLLPKFDSNFTEYENMVANTDIVGYGIVAIVSLNGIMHNYPNGCFTILFRFSH